MKRILILALYGLYVTSPVLSQTKVMTPEQLIELHRVSAIGLNHRWHPSHL